jgi:hypothetical protein
VGVVLVGAHVLGQFGHEGLAEALELAVGLVGGGKVAASDGGTHVVAGDGVAEERFESQRLHDGIVQVRAQVEGSLVGSEAAAVLDPVPAVHPDDARVVGPRHAELQEPVGLHEGLGDEGVLGIALEDGRQALEGGLDGVDEVGLVSVPALGLLHQQIGRLQAGLEPDVALTSEQRLVPPRLADLHGLVHPFLAGYQALAGNVQRARHESRRR